MKASLPVRGADDQGSGHFGAPRGTKKDGTPKTHKGSDYACEPGTGIYPLYPGKVTKLGKPYEDDPDTEDINEYLAYDYVQVTDESGHDHRYFYIEPMVKVGDRVFTNTVIGKTQKLHYSGITQHCHYEVKKDGQYLNPEAFV